ncbi:hypothetical protein OAA39_00375 [bacterium]|nr:hypothetical protein [bacterium]
MNIKDKASRARALAQDETFMEVLSQIRERQTSVFLDSGASIDAIKDAHDIVRALNCIEDYFNTVFADEAIYDKKEEKGAAPWKRLKL